MLRICKDGKKKYQSLGISVLPRYWGDFTQNKPKPNCPNKEYIHMKYVHLCNVDKIKYKTIEKDFYERFSYCIYTGI